MVQSITLETLPELAIIATTCLIYIALGWGLGLAILYFTNPPKHFRNGLVSNIVYLLSLVASANGYWGTMTLAAIMSLGDDAPFKKGDSKMGCAYVAAFLTIANLFLFTYAYKAIGDDFRDMISDSKKDDALKASEKGQKLINEEWSSSQGSFSKWLKSENTQLWIKAICNMCNLAVLLGIIVSFTPCLKRLFVPANPLVKPKVSEEPYFYFLFQIFEITGHAVVPLGLIALGAGIGRVKIDNLMSMKILVPVALVRLVFLPIIGISLVQFFTFAVPLINPEDKILRFVLMFQSGVPSVAAMVYFTQYWHPKGEADEMSSVMLVQYTLAAFTLTFFTIVSLVLVY